MKRLSLYIWFFNSSGFIEFDDINGIELCIFVTDSFPDKLVFQSSN